ncbi:DUF177 domain-containing protein [Bacillaceae bacterium]
MRINFTELANLKGKPLPLEETFDFREAFRNHPEISAVSPIAFHGDASRIGGLVTVDGTIEGELTLRCSRCLKEFVYPLKIKFAEEFAEKEGELAPDGDSDVNLVPDDEFELAPYVEEAVLLHTPFIPVCEEACKGLCPECGADRNEGDCGCRIERIDPRLADLAKFFEQEQEDSQG